MKLSVKSLFKRRGEIAFVAILVVAALHFVFQFSFIRSEDMENSRMAEFPVKNGQVQKSAVEIKATEFKAKKPDNATPPKPIAAVKQRRTETAPSKSLPKKKVPVESRAARLRRAERILTGV